MQQAYTRAIADNGNSDTWNVVKGYFGSTDYANSYIYPYLNIAKKCGRTTNAECEYKYKVPHQDSYKDFDTRYEKFYLSDGAFIAFFITNLTQYCYTHKTEGYWSCSNVQMGDPFKFVQKEEINSATYYVDINGDKKPNKVGRDIFSFEYNNASKKTTDENNNQSTSSEGQLIPSCSVTTREEMKNHCKNDGTCCANLIMNDGWEIKPDYPW